MTNPSPLKEILRIATSDARCWSHWDEVANICERALSQEADSTAPASEPAEIMVHLPHHRVTIDLRDVETIEERGEYPDECTLVMRGGARYSISAGYKKSASQATEHWRAKVSAAKGVTLGEMKYGGTMNGDPFTVFTSFKLPAGTKLYAAPQTPSPVAPEPDELERYKASNQRLSERYNELADALATDPMDSHESRVAKAKRLAAGVGLVGLRDRLQRRCSEMGAYWRASDAHGVDLTAEQATELLRDALGVEVEIKAQPPLVVPREREALPPLPPNEIPGFYEVEKRKARIYTAEQMQAYARAALAGDKAEKETPCK